MKNPRRPKDAGGFVSTLRYCFTLFSLADFSAPPVTAARSRRVLKPFWERLLRSMISVMRPSAASTSAFRSAA